MLAGLNYSKDLGFKKLWEKPTRISMQMVMYSDTREIAVNDFRTGYDNIVVFDTITGEEKGRVPTEVRQQMACFFLLVGKETFFTVQ